MRPAVFVLTGRAPSRSFNLSGEYLIFGEARIIGAVCPVKVGERESLVGLSAQPDRLLPHSDCREERVHVVQQTDRKERPRLSWETSKGMATGRLEVKSALVQGKQMWFL